MAPCRTTLWAASVFNASATQSSTLWKAGQDRARRPSTLQHYPCCGISNVGRPYGVCRTALTLGHARQSDAKDGPWPVEHIRGYHGVNLGVMVTGTLSKVMQAGACAGAITP